jgi:hypothetical protein
MEFLLNNEKNRVLGAYAMLTNEELNMEKLEESVNKLIKFKKDCLSKSGSNHVVIHTPQPTDTGKKKQSGSRSKQYKATGWISHRKPKSADSDAIQYLAKVDNYLLTSIEKNGNDSKLNVLSAKNFLGYGKTKGFKTPNSGKKQLSELTIQSVLFQNEDCMDTVFGGTRQTGCLYYRNLNSVDSGTYTVTVTSMNNTQLFNALFLGILAQGDYRDYAEEFFNEEFNTQADKGLFFKRPEDYHRSMDNFFPSVCHCDGESICIGSHYKWDSSNRLGEILDVIRRFVTYICACEKNTDSSRTRLRDNILSQILLVGWYDNECQVGEPIALK